VRADDGLMSVRVLLVDDDDRFRELARRMLAADGVDVVAEVDNGEAVLDAVAVCGPDVVLLDIRMPGTDGLEVARRLQAQGNGPAVILISTCDPAYGRRAAAGLAAGFLPKEELSLAAICHITGWPS
jgi:DNA-binding NarL/FixJ family response regulator